MKKEQLILSFVAVLFGLLVAGGAFYLFQSTKTIPNTPSAKIVSLTSPTPTNPPAITLNLDRPTDEQVVNSKVLIVSGKTQSNAVITVLTDSSDQVITPSQDGNFSTTVNLSDGQNILEVISIAPNGESVTIKRTVTYSQEEF